MYDVFEAAQLQGGSHRRRQERSRTCVNQRPRTSLVRLPVLILGSVLAFAGLEGATRLAQTCKACRVAYRCWLANVRHINLANVSPCLDGETIKRMLAQTSRCRTLILAGLLHVDGDLLRHVGTSCPGLLYLDVSRCRGVTSESVARFLVARLPKVRVNARDTVVGMTTHLDSDNNDIDRSGCILDCNDGTPYQGADAHRIRYHSTCFNANASANYGSRVVCGQSCESRCASGEMWKRCRCWKKRPSRANQNGMRVLMMDGYREEALEWRKHVTFRWEDDDEDDSTPHGRGRRSNGRGVEKVVRRVACGRGPIALCRPMTHCDVTRIRVLHHMLSSFVSHDLTGGGDIEKAVDIEDLTLKRRVPMREELLSLAELPFLESLDIQRRCFGCEHPFENEYLSGGDAEDPFPLFALRAKCKVCLSGGRAWPLFNACHIFFAFFPFFSLFPLNAFSSFPLSSQIRTLSANSPSMAVPRALQMRACSLSLRTSLNSRASR